MSGVISGLLTLFLLIMFLGIVVWAYSKRNQQAFDEMAKLPLREEALNTKGANHE